MPARSCGRKVSKHMAVAYVRPAPLRSAFRPAGFVRAVIPGASCTTACILHTAFRYTRILPHGYMGHESPEEHVRRGHSRADRRVVDAPAVVRIARACGAAPHRLGARRRRKSRAVRSNGRRNVRGPGCAGACAPTPPPRISAAGVLYACRIRPVSALKPLLRRV